MQAYGSADALKVNHLPPDPEQCRWEIKINGFRSTNFEYFITLLGTLLF